MKNFNLQSMLCCMMFVSITFSMQIRTYTPALLKEMKKKVYPKEEDYQNELKQMRTEMRILTWKDNSNEIRKRYHHQVVDYIPDLSNYVVYEIEWDSDIIQKYTSQIVFFINPMTQKARIFEKHRKGMKPIVYGGVTEFEIETILNYPIVVKRPGESSTKLCRTWDRVMNKPRKLLYHTRGIYVNYKNKKFYFTNEGQLEDVYVFTLDTLCPHISERYIILPKLEHSAKYKLYANRSLKYIKYENDENHNATIDQNHQLQNTNSDQLQNTTMMKKNHF